METGENNNELEHENVSDLSDKFCDDLVGKKVMKSKTIFSVVTLLENLGDLLTDSASVSRRLRGLSILSSTVNKLPNNFLSPEECQLLSNFYCDRTKDHHSLNPEVISGMHGLGNCQNIDGPAIRKLIQTYFNEINTQSQMLQERKIVFKLFVDLLRDKRHMLIPMGNDFVLGYIQAIDGEKDPNNLMLVFGCIPIIVQNFSLEPFTEDLFETIARYFPIDFTPPRLPLGHQIVTKLELVNALRTCFASHSLFAPLAIPLFLEKLDSDLDDSKIDSNLSFIACLQSGYTPQQIKPHMDELWAAHKKEIMGFRLGKPSGKDEEVRKTSISVINAITYQLSQASNDGLTIPEDRAILCQWLEKIWEDCGRHLKELGRSGGEELTLTTTSVNLLSALTCGAGHYSSNYILDKAMPIVLDAVQKASLEEGNQRPLRLQFGTQLIDGSCILQTPQPKWYDSYLHECLVSAFAVNPSISENHEVGCLALVAGMHFLETKDAENIFEHLFKQTIKDERLINEPEKNLYVSLIKKLNFTRPNTEEITIVFNNITSSKTSMKFESSLKFIEVCCHFQSILDNSIFPNVVALITSIAGDPFKLHTCIQLLQNIWDIHQDLSYFLSSDHLAASDTNIFRKILHEASSSEILKHDIRDELITSNKKLIASIAQSFTSDNKDTVQKVLSNFVEFNNREQTLLVTKENFYIFETIICFANKSLLDQLDSSIYQSLFSKTTDKLLPESKQTLHSLSKIRAAIFNKGSSIRTYVDEMYNRFKVCEGKEMRIHALWLFKGLFMRLGFLNMNPWMELFQQWLNTLNTDDANNFADAICSLILVPKLNTDDDFFEYRSSAIGLARQKLFQISKQGLVDSYNNNVNKSAQMRTLISQLPNIPKFLLREEMPTFIPLLINALKWYTCKITYYLKSFIVNTFSGYRFRETGAKFLKNFGTLVAKRIIRNFFYY